MSTRIIFAIFVASLHLAAMRPNPQKIRDRVVTDGDRRFLRRLLRMAETQASGGVTRCRSPVF